MSAALALIVPPGSANLGPSTAANEPIGTESPHGQRTDRTRTYRVTLTGRPLPTDAWADLHARCLEALCH